MRLAPLAAAFLIALMPVALAPSALAQGTGGACEADAARLCPDAGEDRQAAMRCLMQKRSDVSEACDAQLAAMTNILQACRADIETHCSGVQPGGGRIAKCLQEKADAVSEGCKTAIAAMRP